MANDGLGRGRPRPLPILRELVAEVMQALQGFLLGKALMYVGMVEGEVLAVDAISFMHVVCYWATDTVEYAQRSWEIFSGRGGVAKGYCQHEGVLKTER